MMPDPLPVAVRAQRIQRSLHQLPANFFFLLERDLDVAYHMNDAVTENGAVGAHHLSNREGRCDLHCRDAGLFQFRCDRSAAASARPSSRSQYDGIDAQLLHPLRHLAAHATRVRKRIGQS